MDSLYGERIISIEDKYYPEQKDWYKIVRTERGYYQFTEKEWGNLLYYSPHNAVWGNNHVQKKLDQKRMCCEYCGGTTPDDERGNCFACGAPRPKPITCVTEVVTDDEYARYNGITGSSYKLDELELAKSVAKVNSLNLRRIVEKSVGLR